MRIDLHNHTRDGSIDAVTDPDLLAEIARSRGLDGICITEHGKTKTPLADTLRQRHGFLVLAGMEVSTELGDLLVFGVDAIPRDAITARQVRAFLTAKGSVVVAAHPYRWDLSPKPWIGPRDPDLTIEKALAAPLVSLVDAMEAANGWATTLDVEFTREVARRAGLAVTGGSDAHSPGEIGRCITVFEDDIRDEADLVRALKSGRFHAEDLRPEDERGPVKYYLRDF